MKKSPINLFHFFVCISALILACNSEPASSETATSENAEELATITVLSPEEFIKKHNETMEAILIDVRTPQEYAQGAIEGSINRDYHASNFEILLDALDRKYAIFVYCQSGERSNKTSTLLKDMGFKKVYNMEGGYLAWKENSGELD